MSSAKIYRKINCSWSDKAENLLQKKKIPFEVHTLNSEQEEQALKEKYKVKTTPLIFIEDQKVGGYTDLANKFGIKLKDEKYSYIPILTIFTVTALLAIIKNNDFFMSFMGYSLVFLATLKLMDLNSFFETFKKYDLLTKKLPLYGKIYPLAELIIGIGYLLKSDLLALPIISILIGLIGAVSIYKAIYIDKLDLNCACVGGNSNVPLGLVSITENCMMIAMGIYLFLKI